jgi:hypothetical protein
MSIIYIVLSFNKDGNDIISFINYFVHILPALVFFTVFFAYIRFLIEKYYEIKTKKKDIFLDPTMQFFNVVVFVLFAIMVLYSISKNKFT